MTKNQAAYLAMACSAIAAVAAVANEFPASWKPYILLLSVAGAGISGKLGSSWVDHSNDPAIPENKGGGGPARMFFVATLLVASSALAGCGPTLKTVPHLPTIASTGTDAAIRASEIKALRILGRIGALARLANDAEADANAETPVPGHEKIQAAFNDIAQAGLDAVNAIQAHALPDWNALKAKVDPVIDKLNVVIDTINAAGGKGGWRAIVEAVAQIALGLMAPGVFSQGALAPLPSDMPFHTPHTFTQPTLSAQF